MIPDCAELNRRAATKFRRSVVSKNKIVTTLELKEFIKKSRATAGQSRADDSENTTAGLRVASGLVLATRVS